MRNILETEGEKSQCHRSGRGMENKNQMGKKILYESKWKVNNMEVVQKATEGLRKNPNTQKNIEG